MRIQVLIVSFILFISVQVFGQISSGGQPMSWLVNSTQITEPVILILENEYQTPQRQSSNNGGLEFAYLIDVDLNNEQNGNTKILEDGTKVWQLHLKSEGAYSLNFTFSQFYIPEGAELFVYSADKDMLLGAFTSENLKKSGVLAIAPIKGDEIIIEYNEPSDAEFDGYLEIKTIGHDYLNIFGQKDGFFGDSGDCNIDVNCEEGNDWQIEKRSVCRMIINNSTLCTGVLVNNTRQDATPYFLTANHCIEDNGDAENTIFFFNYESPSCNGTDGDASQSISGSELISAKNKDDDGYLDFSLVELSVKVPRYFNPYFAGWNADSQEAESSACIHHPWADVKKISIDNDSPVVASYTEYGYDEETFWKVLEWDAGTTEPGSSGGPLFDQDHRIVGTLSGGEASCGNSVNDLYQMFSASFNSYERDSLQLKNWLDPNNSGVISLNGYAPYSDNLVHHLDAIYHFEPTAQAVGYLTPGGGYVSGNNEYGDLAKAEFFELSEFADRKYVTGGFAYFFKATGNNDTEIEYFIAENINGIPGNDLASATVRMENIKTDIENSTATRFEFFDPVLINSSVYAGIRLPQASGDTIAILNSLDVPENNTAWEQNASETWLAYSNDNSWGSNFMNYIAVEAGWLLSDEEISVNEPTLKLFPNPVNSELFIDLASYISLQSISVYNALGQLVFSEKKRSAINSGSINVANWTEGLYIVHIETDIDIKVARVIVRH